MYMFSLWNKPFEQNVSYQNIIRECMHTAYIHSSAHKVDIIYPHIDLFTSCEKDCFLSFFSPKSPKQPNQKSAWFHRVTISMHDSSESSKI